MAKKKTKVPNLNDPAMKDWEAWLRQWQSEDDHLLILMGVQRVADELVTLIRAKLVAHADAQDALLDHTKFGPVSSFGHQITLATALGLIPPWVARELRSLKDIRNACAHTWSPAAIANSPLLEKCQTLLSARGMKEHRPHKGGAWTPRLAFIFVVGAALVYLQKLRTRTRPLRFQRPWGFDVLCATDEEQNEVYFRGLVIGPPKYAPELFEAADDSPSRGTLSPDPQASAPPKS